MELDDSLDAVLEQYGGLLVVLTRLIPRAHEYWDTLTKDERAVLDVLDAVSDVMPPTPGYGIQLQSARQAADLARLANRARALHAKYTTRAGPLFVAAVTAAHQEMSSTLPSDDVPIEARHRRFVAIVTPRITGLALSELRCATEYQVEESLIGARSLRRLLDAEDDPAKLARAVLRALGASAKRADNIVSGAARMKAARAQARRKGPRPNA